MVRPDSLFLFMGFCLEPSFEKDLSLLPTAFLNQFIGKDLFLNKVIFLEKSYLGKALSPLIKMEEILNMQRHIMSLLLRLVPEYPISPESIRIFAFYGEQHNHY